MPEKEQADLRTPQGKAAAGKTNRKKVNLKAILRIMRKPDLLSQIRRRQYRCTPSMSRPGCPYDNAVMENFFGTLKTECLYRAHFTTLKELEQLIAEYVSFYNNERINLKNGLTPFEIRSKAT